MMSGRDDHERLALHLSGGGMPSGISRSEGEINTSAPIILRPSYASTSTSVSLLTRRYTVLEIA